MGGALSGRLEKLGMGGSTMCCWVAVESVTVVPVVVVPVVVVPAVRLGGGRPRMRSRGRMGAARVAAVSEGEAAWDAPAAAALMFGRLAD